MKVGGDPEELRATARRVRTWASDVETEASRVFRVGGVGWESTAASGFIEKVGERHRDTTDVVESMRHAAGTYDDLARTLEGRQEKLLKLLEEAGKTIEDAEEMVAKGAKDLLEGAESLAGAAKEKGEELLDKGKDALDSLSGGLL